MPGFALTNKAIADLKEFGYYTQSRWSYEQRNMYLTMLDACFNQLAANPLKGKDCGNIRSGYRKHPAGRHIIFYRPLSKDTIEIVRILHERMDIETRLSESQ
jgi:toxin ParE1/3/4